MLSEFAKAGYDYVKLTDTSGSQLGTALSGQPGSVWSGEDRGLVRSFFGHPEVAYVKDALGW